MDDMVYYFCMENKQKKKGLRREMAQDFCFLKGLVDCKPGRVQDCNFKHVNKCPLQEEMAKEKEKKKTSEEGLKFCFLKGIVDCSAGRVQDCNFKHVNKCPLKK